MQEFNAAKLAGAPARGSQSIPSAPPPETPPDPDQPADADAK
jgi:hypothetical protein